VKGKHLVLILLITLFFSSFLVIRRVSASCPIASMDILFVENGTANLTWYGPGPHTIGDTFVVHINVTGVSGLWGWQASAKWDPSYLNCTAISWGEFLTLSGGGLQQPSNPYTYVDNTGGQLYPPVAEASTSSAVTIARPVRLLSMTFKTLALPPPGGTVIWLTNTKVTMVVDGVDIFSPPAYILGDATFKFTIGIQIGGSNYPITIESNVTITNVTPTKNALIFTTSGPTGVIGYINTTTPVGLNKTAIKVFIDGVKLTPPPFPIITTNGTHYFIYFEFTLSTHNITIQYAIADIATTNITSTKIVVGQGYTVRINATIQNQGDYTETFNITVYANTTIIETKEVTLTSGNLATITFIWNTTGFAYGNYTISAYAWQVEGETDTLDNNCTFAGLVFVTIAGDVTSASGSPDGRVDMRDIGALCSKFMTTPSHLQWNPNYDINDDDVVNMRDIGIACNNFMKDISS